MKNLFMRLVKSAWFKKFLKYGLLVAVIFYGIYSFKHQFNIVHQDGIYGIVTEAKWDQIVNNGVKAHAYDTIPEAYYER